MIRRKYIRSIVERLLVEHHIHTYPVPVKKLAIALGNKVQLEPAEDELSGFLYQDRDKKMTIIGVNSNQHPKRQNFTIAHELGHLLLHNFSGVHVDRKFQVQVWNRDKVASQGVDTQEREANLFAAELLMPASFLAKSIEEIGAIDLIDDEVIKNLANQYGVSIQAMTFRLSNLGYLEV